ncbi:radical SAM protein [bacterium]|nr:radical SAM protein [bacterium]
MTHYALSSKKLAVLLEKCTLCPRQCKVNRLKGEKGFCRAGKDPVISSFNLHFGEEPPISGIKGSGTIFFTHCNLRCVFCQNYPISQLGNGKEISIEKLSQIMLKLQEDGACNINLVTPTHFVPQIIEAYYLARKKHLQIPLVYNCSGYESIETLKLLEGIVDIYMPDSKYSNNNMALRYSNSFDYWQINKLALKEMFRQVGELKFNKQGIAIRGLLVRHLVLPKNISGSREIFRFIAREISPNTYMSIMSQYHPAHLSYQFTELSRKISIKEYQEVLRIADKEGLHQGWRQEL